jgi:hypothetical protein
METERYSEKSRQRSSRRLRHEAEVKVFQDQTGTLEGIRKQLGLRPSQICEILKVHPSAWTRWSRINKAPPHVYQMLEWYLELLQWRGQHHPLKDRPLNAHIQSREDLQTYVPEEIDQKATKIGLPARWTKILVFVWCIQIVLWCIVMTVLLKHF